MLHYVVYEIVILAMIAAFLGMRLYSVLGRRAESEEEPVPRRFDSGERPANREDTARPDTPKSDTGMRAIPAPTRNPELDGIVPAVERGIADISSADRSFDLLSFLEGAKGAYEMILESFWRGDKEALQELCDDDVYASFAGAIDAREEAGDTLENRLIRIEDTKVHSARIDGKIARIAVLFVADIAAITRDKDGTMIGGSLDDALESRDVWTFMRDVSAPGPNWILDETDEG